MRIDKNELITIFTCNNNVLLKPIIDTNKTQTKSGVSLYTDTTYKPEHHSRVLCEVVSMPRSLIFSKKHPEYSMEWECEPNLRIGEKVLINYLAGLTADKHHYIEMDGEKLYFVPYDKIIMVFRDDETIMLNGYVLVERIKAGKLSTRIYVPDQMEEQLGIVRYLHEPNLQYLNRGEEDDNAVRVGDVVVLAYKNFPKLEDPLHRVFDKEKEYIFMQRKHILAIIKNYETQEIKQV